MAVCECVCVCVCERGHIGMAEHSKPNIRIDCNTGLISMCDTPDYILVLTWKIHKQQNGTNWSKHTLFRWAIPNSAKCICGIFWPDNVFGAKQIRAFWRGFHWSARTIFLPRRKWEGCSRIRTLRHTRYSFNIMLCSPRYGLHTKHNTKHTQNTHKHTRAPPLTKTRLDNNHAKCQLNLTDERRRLAAPRASSLLHNHIMNEIARKRQSNRTAMGMWDSRSSSHLNTGTMDVDGAAKQRSAPQTLDDLYAKDYQIRIARYLSTAIFSPHFFSLGLFCCFNRC